MVVGRGGGDRNFKKTFAGPSRDARRQASTDSEESSHPLKKASVHARPSGQDDPDYENDLHEGELVLVCSTTKRKKKAPTASSSHPVTTTGIVLSMANPTNGGRLFVDY